MGKAKAEVYKDPVYYGIWITEPEGKKIKKLNELGGWLDIRGVVFYTDSRAVAEVQKATVSVASYPPSHYILEVREIK